MAARRAEEISKGGIRERHANRAGEPRNLVSWQARGNKYLLEKNEQQYQLLVGGHKCEAESQDLNKARQRPGLMFGKDS